LHIVVVGVNHKTAPVELRERLAVDSTQVQGALTALRWSPHVREICIVSTCNRTELYAVTNSRTEDAVLIKFLAGLGGLAADEIDDSVYCWAGHHAAKHLFEVACGLDSLALGETQILGQIRNAYCIADECKFTGGILNTLFQQAISVGKRARVETGISSGAFSIGAAAAQHARLVLGTLAGRTALLVGAGDMSKLAATHLRASGIERILIANRTRARVEPLASELQAEVVDFKQLEDALSRADIVISSTSSRKPIITRDMIERVMRSRRHAPVFLIDIAVPRDVESAVAGLEGVFVYNIDDLRFMVDRCKAEREAEVEKVHAIIEEETAEFMANLRAMEAVPLIKQLREKFDSVYAAEWERCLSKLGHLSEDDLERVQRALRSTASKLMHDPLIRMKEYASNGGAEKLEVVRELFGLPPKPPVGSG
jgi:glutamyl-tRNA reductase